MILDDTLLDDLEAKAKQSPRLRMNLNLHDSLDSKAQRLLNALLPGTVIPIHRHRHTAETYAILRGRMFVVFYDSMGGAVERILLDSRSGHYGVHIPKGQWHAVEVIEPSVILEVKDGPYMPLQPEDTLD
ncbi:MAG TPA: WbuC family cupin fold metalloprotein [Candidatus Coprenecus avistercoris]|jgi:cupin fold WbuC family metalloprotein|uniref:WbuC family cupin fold metalloprotein n=1 Tax=Candidatus Coprenecus avistercoris TaxID=2840730 RepID=A0A9D1E0E2_9BACT|nr:WbuC family cupin fold metalloprotein [Candidatus Coprenecus avistercoris]